MKNWTGERLETFVNNKNTIDHLHRYAVAGNFITDKIVLDIACGEGYGTNLMSLTARFVYGVDIDNVTIKKANLKYKKANIEFKQGNAAAIPMPDSSVDVIVSYETIEHHDHHEEMMSEIKRVLKQDGVLIISTPDKLNYSDKRNYNNQFHVKELYKNEFSLLVSQKFRKIQMLNQKFVNGNSIIQPDEEINIDVYTGNYFQIELNRVDALYLVIIASDIDFKDQLISIFDGSRVLEADLDQKISKVYNSKSYKIGNFLIRPYRILRKIVK